MPQLIVLVLAGAGLAAGYRWLARQAEGVAGDLKKAEEALRRRTSGAPLAEGESARDLGTLEWDEQAGVYRPGRSGG